MARTTSQLRAAWAPACKRVNRPNMEQAFAGLDACLKAFNYRPKAGQTFSYNCRRITGGSGYSLHAYGDNSDFRFWTGVSVPMAVAVDINSLSNPYGRRLITDMPRAMVDAILRIRTNGGHPVWHWGGYYSGNKDAMHYELNCSPAELATGINWKTVTGSSGGPGPQPNVPTPPQPVEEDDMKFVYKIDGVGALFLTDWVTTHTLSYEAWVHLGNLGQVKNKDNIYTVPMSLHTWLISNTSGGNVPTV